MYDLLVGEPHSAEWNSVSSAFGSGGSDDVAVAVAVVIFFSPLPICV